MKITNFVDLVKANYQRSYTVPRAKRLSQISSGCLLVAMLLGIELLYSVCRGQLFLGALHLTITATVVALVLVVASVILIMRASRLQDLSDTTM